MNKKIKEIARLTLVMNKKIKEIVRLNWLIWYVLSVMRIYIELSNQICKFTY